MTAGPAARLFVAVWPPSEVADALAALPRPVLPGLRWTTPDQWHVTLRFLGTVAVDDAVEAFRRIELGRPAVATLGPVVGRFGSRVLQVPVTGLEALAAATVGATAALGKAPADRSFTGHLTLARVRRPGAVDLRPLTGAPVSGRWVVGELTLVRSHTAAAGARYQVLAARLLPPATAGA